MSKLIHHALDLITDTSVGLMGVIFVCRSFQRYIRNADNSDWILQPEFDGQTYTYFLVRGNGSFLVKTREGAETNVVQEWTEHAAIDRDDEQGQCTNTIAAEVRPEEVAFFVNDQLVHTAPRAELPTEGRCGYRLVHDLHVRFGPLQIAPLDQ